MKLGMNLFLWTTHVTQEHYPLFAQLAAEGYGAPGVVVLFTDDPMIWRGFG